MRMETKAMSCYAHNQHEYKERKAVLVGRQKISQGGKAASV